MNENYHDSAVFKLEYIDHKQSLIVALKKTDGEIYHMVFNMVMGWIFTPFEIQNILFDFKVYSNNNIPNSIYEEYEIPSEYKNILKRDEAYSLGVFNPSVGLGGFVIFKELTVRLVE